MAESIRDSSRWEDIDERQSNRKETEKRKTKGGKAKIRDVVEHGVYAPHGMAGPGENGHRPLCRDRAPCRGEQSSAALRHPRPARQRGIARAAGNAPWDDLPLYRGTAPVRRDLRLSRRKHHVRQDSGAARHYPTDGDQIGDDLVSESLRREISEAAREIL